MWSHGGATAVSGHSSKPKSREVSSRFLSPTSTSSAESVNQSPNSILSPKVNKKSRSSTDSRKHKSLDSGFLRGLWPSSSNSKPDTLADCIGNDRLRELEEQKIKEKPNRNSLLLNRQRSCTEFSRFEKEKNSVSKENHNPIFGGSMRYTGNFKFPRKSSKYSNSNSNSSNENEILPGRFSVDENLLTKKSFPRGLSDSDECSDVYSDDTSFGTPVAGKASYMAPTVSSKKHGIEIPSKFMNDLSSRSRRWSADSKPVSSNSNENSPNIFTVKKKGNNNGSFSTGRSGPTISDNKGKMVGLTGLKPPTSPSRGKGVGNILSLGIELLKGRKSSSRSSLGPGSAENVHQLRLMHNRLTQWRYTNARAESVNHNIIKQAEGDLVHVWNALIKLRRSVVQKKLQLQKENLNKKLNFILHSQIKALETWGNMERQHLSAVTNTTDYLHYVICRIPLIDRAKVEPHSASIALRHASDLAASMKSMLTSFSSSIEETEGIFAELAVVVIQERQLLEECMELFRYISKLEIQERSLKIMQLQQQQQHILT